MGSMLIFWPFQLVKSAVLSKLSQDLWFKSSLPESLLFLVLYGQSLNSGIQILIGK